MIYMYYQTSLHECKFLIEMHLNWSSIFFIVLYKDDKNFNQSPNQHWNVLEIKIITVKNSLK